MRLCAEKPYMRLLEIVATMCENCAGFMNSNVYKVRVGWGEVEEEHLIRNHSDLSEFCTVLWLSLTSEHHALWFGLKWDGNRSEAWWVHNHDGTCGCSQAAFTYPLSNSPKIQVYLARYCGGDLVHTSSRIREYPGVPVQRYLDLISRSEGAK